MLRSSIAAVAITLLGLSVVATAEENRWEKTIQRFEAKDKENPPPQGEILFIGSSSIVAWKTDKDFPDHTIINRGFGGSVITDSTHFADRIAIPYAPRLIVFYAGDNDISRGDSAEKVLQNYKAFVAKIHGALPETRIAFVCIKPSIARWELIDTMRAANEKVKKYSEDNPLLDCIDIDTPMIGEDGKPRKELFIADGLHLSREGYDLWNEQVLPYLEDE